MIKFKFSKFETCFLGSLFCFCYAYFYLGYGGKTCDMVIYNRLDCHPERDADQNKCQMRNCCWKETLNHLDIPYCFYPKNFDGYYEIINYTIIMNYYQIVLKYKPNAIYSLLNIAKIYISCVENVVKININPKKHWPSYNTCPLIEIIIDTEAQLIKFIRKNTKFLLLEIEINTLIFTSQYNQVNFNLNSTNLFGLGEDQAHFLRKFDYSRISMHASDQAPLAKKNLYGSQPFYMIMESYGNSHGLVLLNSQPLEFTLSPRPSVTIRTSAGGPLHFVLFPGPLPEMVISQFTKLIGRPSLPPYWSLGFHLCRFGYGSLKRLITTLQRNLALQIPIDVQWTDIDVMENRKDFTYDRKNFKGLPAFINDIRKAGMRYVPIIDAAIKYAPNLTSYKPFMDGIGQDIFIKSGSKTSQLTNQTDLLVGRVWPDLAVWPDFTHPSISSYWTEQFKYFINGLRRDFRDFEQTHMPNLEKSENFTNNMISLDGIWLDMNEPSNFVDGSINGCDLDNKLNKPFYTPRINGGSLYYKTICMDAKHYNSTHFDNHNLYGLQESRITYRASLALNPNKRPFIISRSNYLGLGAYAGHWSGDVYSTYDAMAKTIPSMLNYNLFGIPITGSDICGFNGNTTAELCLRWYQLGAFYPFARTHNTDDAFDQDPAAFYAKFPILVNSTRRALMTRYSLLPYLYTLFWKANRFGETVARPLFFEFPNDTKTYANDKQFLWGSCLMISPVLTKSTTRIKAYFPNQQGREIWYDFYNGSQLKKANHVELDADQMRINLHVRGGCIIPMQKPALNTILSQQNDFNLLIGLDKFGKARGDLYMDDGETLTDNNELTLYNYIKFQITQPKKLTSLVHKNGYIPVKPYSNFLTNVTIFGVVKKPQKVILMSSYLDNNNNNNNTDIANNNKKYHETSLDFKYNNLTQALTILDLHQELTTAFEMTWK